MSALTVFLYGIGSAQEFLDSTQMVLLRLAAVLGILLFVCSICGFFLDIFYSIMERTIRFIWGACAYLFSTGFGVFVALFANGVLVLVAGNLS